MTLSAMPLDEAVARLTPLDPSDLPVVSVYWSVPDDLGQLNGAKSKLHDLAKRVRERAEDPSATHAERVSLRADANRILQLEDLVPVLQGRAVGFFGCDRRGLEEAVLLPNRVRDRVEIGPTPFIRPLLGVLDEAHRYAALRPKVIGTFVIDPRTTTPGKTRAEVGRVVEDYERREEEQVVARALDRVASGGAAAAGLDWCLLAANELAIDLLLALDFAFVVAQSRANNWTAVRAVDPP